MESSSYNTNNDASIAFQNIDFSDNKRRKSTKPSSTFCHTPSISGSPQIESSKNESLLNINMSLYHDKEDQSSDYESHIMRNTNHQERTFEECNGTNDVLSQKTSLCLRETQDMQRAYTNDGCMEHNIRKNTNYDDYNSQSSFQFPSQQPLMPESKKKTAAARKSSSQSINKNTKKSSPSKIISQETIDLTVKELLQDLKQKKNELDHLSVENNILLDDLYMSCRTYLFSNRQS